MLLRPSRASPGLVWVVLVLENGQFQKLLRPYRAASYLPETPLSKARPADQLERPVVAQPGFGFQVLGQVLTPYWRAGHENHENKVLC